MPSQNLWISNLMPTSTAFTRSEESKPVSMNIIFTYGVWRCKDSSQTLKRGSVALKHTQKDTFFGYNWLQNACRGFSGGFSLRNRGDLMLSDVTHVNTIYCRKAENLIFWITPNTEETSTNLASFIKWSFLLRISVISPIRVLWCRYWSFRQIENLERVGIWNLWDGEGHNSKSTSQPSINA